MNKNKADGWGKGRAQKRERDFRPNHLTTVNTDKKKTNNNKLQLHPTTEEEE